MKCPKGRHDNYCSEEDSLYNTEADAAECVLCIRDERNALAEALRATVDLLEEAHQYESDNGHGGDDGPCSYCDGIDAARAALEKAGAG